MRAAAKAVGDGDGMQTEGCIETGWDVRRESIIIKESFPSKEVGREILTPHLMHLLQLSWVVPFFPEEKERQCIKP